MRVALANSVMRLSGWILAGAAVVGVAYSAGYARALARAPELAAVELAELRAGIEREARLMDWIEAGACRPGKDADGARDAFLEAIAAE